MRKSGIPDLANILYFFNPPQKVERHGGAAFKRVVEYLLAIVPGVASENPDYDGCNPRQQVAHHGHEGTVDILIGAGIGVNSISDRQEICLHLAAENGKVDVVDLLLRRGASVDFSRYWDGRTALYLAADKGCPQVVKSLVRSAYINAVDDAQQTPLHQARQV